MRLSLSSLVFAGVSIGGVLLPSHGEEVEAAPTFGVELANRFAGWDGNSDGALSVAEVDQAIANGETRGVAAATAVALRQTMIRAKAERMSLADAQKNAGAEKTLGWALKRLQRAPRVLYAQEKPNPESLRQGKLGDCFCLAGLRAVLQRDPGALATMIQPGLEGGYRVKIGATEVAVSGVTDGEIILGASAEDGLWPIVYEKAVGLYRTKDSDRTATPFAVVTRGGSAGAMMAKLTASEITRWSAKAWRDAAATPEKQAALLGDLREQLQSAFAEKRLVTTGTGVKPSAGAVPGVTYSHGYAVLGYDAARDEVRLWNPHGNAFKPKGDAGLANGYPHVRGEWSAPLPEVVTFLAGFAFEKKPGAQTTPKGETSGAVEASAPRAGK